MPTSHARIVRGLSIATIVISALAILAVAVAAVFMGFLGSYLSDPVFLQSLMNETDSYSSLTIDELSLFMSLGVGTIMVALVWSLVCSVVTLVGGIMGMRGASRPEKLGGAFGWAIAGAVASFLTGRIITTVLFVIAAVYLNKMRNAPVAAYGQPVAPYGQPAGYGQQPSQPMGYVQPGAYVQPMGYDQQLSGYAQGQQEYAQPTGYQQPAMQPAQSNAGEAQGQEQPANSESATDDK